MKLEILPSSVLRHILLLTLILNTMECTGSDSSNAEYEKEVMDFRQRRVKFLKSEKGYLNLVGLFWLKEGLNSFGSGIKNDLQFPETFPIDFGYAKKAGKIVSFHYNEQVTLKNGQSVTSATIDADDRSQVFSRDSFSWFILESGGNYAIRMRDFENPILGEPLYLKFYDIAESWRITGQYTAYEGLKNRNITNIRDIDYEQKTPGIITFRRSGKLFTFEPTLSGDGMSVIFMDKTTGKETFAGGRFLVLDKPDENGDIILDFNKALNFPCAYNAYTTCPIPPEKNRLPLIVSAGEKTYNN